MDFSIQLLEALKCQQRSIDMSIQLFEALK